MKNTHPYVIIGNALSSMVAATELAQAGYQVTLVNGTNNWGGHFTTLNFDGIAYDGGMVLHEFTSYGVQSEVEDISTYNAAIRNDTGRFCKTIAHYVGRFQKTHEVNGIQTYVDGQYYDDLLIANALTTLKKLPFAEQVRTELATLVADTHNADLHASKKHTSAYFNRLPFESVSLANHGATLHAKLFEPYCKKLLNISTADVVALYHRVPWLPLFYPETLLSYLQGSPQVLPPTVFDYPDTGCIGDLAGHLKTEILQSSNIQVINKFPTQLKRTDDGEYEVSFDELPSIKTGRLAWSSGLAELLKVAGAADKTLHYDKASFTLVFAKVLASKLTADFSVLSIADTSSVFYRVTDQTRCNNDTHAEYHRLVVELNYDYLMVQRQCANHQDLQALIAKELVAIGVINDEASFEVVKTVDLKNALQLPNAKNIQAFEDELAAVKSLMPSIVLLAGASGFSSSSFNHQVLQGLKLAQTWSV
jgi:NAD(P)-binding Rossmann-like domain